MKKLIIFLLFSSIATAQFGLRSSSNEQFILSTHVDVSASIKENGLDQVVEIEYAGPYIYTKAGIEYVTGLPVTTYFDWHGAIGFNLISGHREQLRYYTGLRIGRIYRGSYGANGFLGFETGTTYALSNQLRIGLRATLDQRNDQKLFGDPVIWRGSGFLTLEYVVKTLK